MIRNQKQILLNLYLLSLIACKSMEQEKKCKIEASKYTISFPADCQNISLAEEQGGFSGIVLINNDTLFFNFGIVLNKLTEPEPNVLYIPPVKGSDNAYRELDTSYVITHDRNYDLDDYRKQNVYYEELDNLKAKIVVPRREIGLTGIYIDSVYTGSVDDVYGNLKFNFYGEGLSRETKDIFLSGIKSIKFNLQKKQIIPHHLAK